MKTTTKLAAAKEAPPTLADLRASLRVLDNTIKMLTVLARKMRAEIDGILPVEVVK
jgi:hypothetical protein